MPSAEVNVELALEFVHFLANALNFDGLFAGGRGEAAEVGHVALQGVDFALFHFVDFAGSGSGGGFCGLRFHNFGGLGAGSQGVCRWFCGRGRGLRGILRGELGGGRFARGAAGFFDRTKLLHALFALAAFAQLLGENLALAH